MWCRCKRTSIANTRDAVESLKKYENYWWKTQFKFKWSQQLAAKIKQNKSLICNSWYYCLIVLKFSQYELGIFFLSFPERNKKHKHWKGMQLLLISLSSCFTINITYITIDQGSWSAVLPIRDKCICMHIMWQTLFAVCVYRLATKHHLTTLENNTTQRSTHLYKQL